MSNVGLNAWVQALRQHGRDTGQRHLLLISGERDWCLRQVSLLADVEQALWLSAEATPGRRVLSPDKARTMLGQEVEMLVCDVFSTGFDPVAIAALSGTVTAGGLVVMLAPPLTSWAAHDDPVARRMAIHGMPSSTRPSRYLQRLVRLLKEDSRFSLLTQDEGLTAEKLSSPGPSRQVSERTEDQQRVIRAITALSASSQADALVVTAARGRGKSAALGIALAELLRQAGREIWLTAPRLQNSEVIFRHLLAALPAAQRERNRVDHAGSTVRFLAPDALLEQEAAPDLLMVDEAAAIPAEMLLKMLRQFGSIVLASTEQGYEGSARGFAIGFRRQLDQHRPGWRLLTMATPIRWAEYDPVESLLDDLLLLDTAAPPAPDSVHINDIRIEQLDRDKLAADEERLRSVFGLLVDAHYQTTPMDVRHLLDGENIVVWIATSKSRLIAAVMAAQEGGLDASLSIEIFRGKRRPRGHLLPQLLTARGSDPLAATRRCLRIIRIAVHPAVQRRGIGKRMLAHIRAQLKDVDYFGASFALHPGVLQFWRRSGFVPLHLGLKANTAAGTPAVTVAAGIGSAGMGFVAGARTFFVSGLLCLLPDAFRELDASNVLALLAEQGAQQKPTALSDTEMALVEAVAYGQRGYESCCAAVRNAVILAIEANRFHTLSTRQQQALLQRTLQCRDWKEIAAATGCSGRNEAVSLLREALRTLLQPDA